MIMNRERNAALSESIRSGDVATVRRMLVEDDSILQVDWGRGRTWLHKAAEFDQPEVVEELVRAGIDINAKLVDEPQTPLHVAALKRNAAVARWLVEHGADVNVGGGNYPTPLSYAASGSLEIVKLLVEHGAAVNTCHDTPPRNPLFLAQKWKQQDIEEYLRAHGALLPSETPEAIRARRHQDEVEEHLLTHVGRIHFLLGVDEGAFRTWVLSSGPEKGPVLVGTCGLSEYEMSGVEPSRVELVFELPAGWPIDSAALDRDKHGWPLKWLRNVGEQVVNRRLPIGEGHTFATEAPSEALGPGTKMSAILLLEGVSPFRTMVRSDGQEVGFLSMFPIYREELLLKETDGFAALLKAFAARQIPMAFAPKRVPAVRGN
jgi:hypothetical protein